MLTINFVKERYELKQRIGQGGMGEVWEALDHNFTPPRTVALKLLPAHLANNLTIQQWFAHEAAVLAGLEDDGIVPIHDMGEHDGRPFLVMRHLPGGTLKQKLEAGEITLQRATEIIARLATALTAVHEKGIVHLDIKASNILFDERDRVFLTDFGIARRIDETHFETIVSDGRGTPAFMAPEQWENGAISPKTDIYQFGALIYQLVTGERPFSGNADALRNQHLHRLVPSVKGRNKALNNPVLVKRMDELIAEAMAKQPAARRRAPSAIADEFSAIVNNLPRVHRTQPTQTEPPPPPLPPERAARGRTWGWAWAAGSATGWGGAVAVALGVLLLAALQNDALGMALTDPAITGVAAGGAAGALLLVLAAALSGWIGGLFGAIPVALTVRAALARAGLRVPPAVARRAGVLWGVLLILGLAYSFGGTIFAGAASAEGIGRPGLIVDFLTATFTFGCLLPAAGAAILTGIELMRRDHSAFHVGGVITLLLGWLAGGLLTWLVAALLTVLAAVFLLVGVLATLGGAL